MRHLTTDSIPDKSFETLTYAATLSVPFNLLRPNKKITLTGNIAVTTTSTVNGSSGIYAFVQDATGNRTVTINSTLVTINPNTNSSTIVGWFFDGALYSFDTNYTSPITQSSDSSVISRASSSGSRYVVSYGVRTVEGQGGGGLSDGSVIVETSRIKYQAVGNTSDISVKYINSNRSSIDNATAANTINITASLEYDFISPSGTVTSNTITILTFKGSNTVALPWNKSIETDVVTAEIPSGAFFWIRTCVTVSTGQKWYKPIATRSGYTEGVVSGSDMTVSGTIANSTTYCFGPSAILGVSNTRKASVYKLGDSIASGQGDSGFTQFSFNEGGGLFGRAFQNNWPGIGSNRGGDSFADELPQARPQFSTIMGTCHYFISQLGVNDLSRTLMVNQTSAVAIWDSFMARGVFGYQTTITPTTTSTDAWVTTTNQTVTENESKRVGFNDWLRNGAPIDKDTRVVLAVGATGANVTRIGLAGHPLLGYFDVADAIESARNSGKFKNSGGAVTNDGLHLNANGYAIGAAAIDTTKFLLY